MKRMLLLVLPALLCACSSPRYTYYFDRYDYSEGRGKPRIVQQKEENKSDEIHLSESDLMADASRRIVLEERSILPQSPSSVTDAETYTKRPESRNIESLSKFSRKERREFVRELKDAIRESKKNTHQTATPDEINVMDKDLKMAIIFGAVGLTLSLFTGVNAAFGVLGVVAIVVGVVFLVRWLIRQ